MNILVVEDDIDSRKFMVKFLSKYGDCEAAADGVQALSMFEQAHADRRPYDLICLDIVMPKQDGYETLKKIREYEEKHGLNQYQEVKVIMTSGVEVTSGMPKAFEYGCVAYATKPIDIVKFHQILQQLKLI